MRDEERTEKTWSLAALKPGDEVGIELANPMTGRLSHGVGVVESIDEDGIISLVGDDHYSADGHNLFSRAFTNSLHRLVAPTDAMRLEQLQEDAKAEMEALAWRIKAVPRETLERLLAVLKEVMPEETE